MDMTDTDAPWYLIAVLIAVYVLQIVDLIL
jgi:hypothetical protein